MSQAIVKIVHYRVAVNGKINKMSLVLIGEEKEGKRDLVIGCRPKSQTAIIAMLCSTSFFPEMTDEQAVSGALGHSTRACRSGSVAVLSRAVRGCN